jgi:hypothetical protein
VGEPNQNKIQHKMSFFRALGSGIAWIFKTSIASTIGSVKILGLILALAILTKPSHELLAIYLYHYYKASNEDLKNSKIPYLIQEGVTIVANKLTTLTIWDWIIFKTATAHFAGSSHQNQFIGIFNGWYSIGSSRTTQIQTQ